MKKKNFLNGLSTQPSNWMQEFWRYIALLALLPFDLFYIDVAKELGVANIIT